MSAHVEEAYIVSETLESQRRAERNLGWIDSHAHLDFDRFDDDRTAVLERARERGVRHIISIGTRVDSTRRAVELARAHPEMISATAGFHPLYMGDDHPQGWEEITSLIGEKDQ